MAHASYLLRKEWKALKKCSLGKRWRMLELDPLDGLTTFRPYWWHYVQCATDGCVGWVWAQKLGQFYMGNLQIRCYMCQRPWRDGFQTHGFRLWR